MNKGLIIVEVINKLTYSPHPNPLPQGERGLNISPPLTGGDVGEGVLIQLVNYNKG